MNKELSGSVWIGTGSPESSKSSVQATIEALGEELGRLQGKELYVSGEIAAGSHHKLWDGMPNSPSTVRRVFQTIQGASLLWCNKPKAKTRWFSRIENPKFVGKLGDPFAAIDLYHALGDMFEVEYGVFDKAWSEEVLLVWRHALCSTNTFLKQPDHFLYGVSCSAPEDVSETCEEWVAYGPNVPEELKHILEKSERIRREIASYRP